MIGVIGGTSFLKQGFLAKPKKKKVKTPYGTVTVFVEKGVAFIPRHAKNTPPHKINHKANVYALKKAGCKKIIGISSAGSMKKSIKPGTLVVPHDYIDLQNKYTFYDNRIVHITPGLDAKVRKALCQKGVRKRGVYLQTRGPRIETPAEIKLFSKYADLVGMTQATEATLAKELGVGYAGICTIDNYAHGLGTKVTYAAIKKSAAKNAVKVSRVVKKAVQKL